MSDEQTATLPKVLLLGLRKSGKSSIQKVVFECAQPHDTVNLPTTVTPARNTVCSNDFVRFDVWDFPGQSDPLDTLAGARYGTSHLLENCGAIVFVMDCREHIDEAKERLMATICIAYRHDPELCVEVFIHKVDALSEDHQADLLANLRRRVEEEVRQRMEIDKPLRLNFNLTSIYDHSVFQAFSLVIQRLLKTQLQAIPDLLQMLNRNSNIDLSYLFISRSKIYLALEESNRLKSHTYELCSDSLEAMAQIARVYEGPAQSGLGGASNANNSDLRGTGSFSETQRSQFGDEKEVIPASKNVVSPYVSGAVFHLRDDFIYVRELPNSLTLVMMIKEEDLQNKILIDYNINIFYKAAYKKLTAFRT